MIEKQTITYKKYMTGRTNKNEQARNNGRERTKTKNNVPFRIKYLRETDKNKLTNEKKWKGKILTRKKNEVTEPKEIYQSVRSNMKDI